MCDFLKQSEFSSWEEQQNELNHVRFDFFEGYILEDNLIVTKENENWLYIFHEWKNVNTKILEGRGEDCTLYIVQNENFSSSDGCVFRPWN